MSVTDWADDVTLVVADNEHDEIGAIVSLVSAALADSPPTEPSEVLVLLRTDSNGSASRELARRLKAAGIETYLPRAELGTSTGLQILLEYMKLAQSPADDLALRSLLELEDNRVGKTRIRAIVQLAWDREIPLSEALSHLEANPDDYGSTGLPAVLLAVRQIRSRAAAFAQQPGEDFATWIERLVDALGVRGEALDAVAEAARYVEDTLDAMGVDASSPVSFIQEITAALAEIKDSRPPRVDGKVTITTMHGSKGLSADVVFVLIALAGVYWIIRVMTSQFQALGAPGSSPPIKPAASSFAASKR